MAPGSTASRACRCRHGASCAPVRRCRCAICRTTRAASSSPASGGAGCRSRWRTSSRPRWRCLRSLCAAAVRQQRTLLSEGRPASAVVTAVRKHKGSHGAAHREIVYEFPVLAGTIANGKAAAGKARGRRGHDQRRVRSGAADAEPAVPLLARHAQSRVVRPWEPQHDFAARHAPGRPRDGADDQGLEPAVSPALSGARRARDDERDGARAPPEAEAPARVRAHPAGARRAVLRRATGGEQAGRNGLGGRTGGIPRRRSRRREPRLPDRLLHQQGARRGARPRAPSRAAHRRGDETGGAADSGHREDPPRVERRAPELPRRRARGGRGGRRRDLRPRPHARGPLHDVGRLERDRRGRGRGAGAGHRQRRPAVPPRDRRRAAAPAAPPS